MKKLLTILLLFCAVSSIAQLPITQNLGSDSTLIRIGNNSKGALRGSLIPSTYTDTTQANAGRIDDYPFAIIATSGDGNTWQRNYLATGWVLIGGGSDPSGLFFKVGGNLFPVTVPSRNIGTLAPYGGAIGLMTNSVVHAIVPDAGFTLANDTTAAKVFTWNPTSKEWGYANWNNGGGATPTLQQVLTAGSTLTVSNSIDAGGFNFNLRQVDTLSNAATIKEDSLTRYIMVTPNYESSFRIRDNGVDALIVDIGDVEDSGNGTNVALSDATGIIQLQAQLGGVILDGGYTKILNLANATTQDVLIGQTNIGDELGYITIGSGLSLSSGVLSASGGGGGTPGGSNKQIQYNNSGSFGGSGNLTQETNQILVTGTSTSVVPFAVKQIVSQSSNTAEFQNSSGTNLVSIGVGGQVVSVQNITAFSGASEQVQIGYTNLGSASVAFGASSDTYLYKLSAGRLRIYNGSTDGDLTARSATWSGRVLLAQGADVASAAGAITLGADGNSFEITGTAAITLISNTNWQNGSEVTLLFTSTATLTDGTANSGTDIGMELSGNTNFTGSAGATLTLILSEIGGTQRWREKCRSVN